MLEDKNDIRLLYQSIQELASEMGQSQLNTKTVSLIFLEMDLKYSVLRRFKLISLNISLIEILMKLCI